MLACHWILSTGSLKHLFEVAHFCFVSGFVHVRAVCNSRGEKKINLPALNRQATDLCLCMCMCVRVRASDSVQTHQATPALLPDITPLDCQCGRALTGQTDASCYLYLYSIFSLQLASTHSFHSNGLGGIEDWKRHTGHQGAAAAGCRIR